MLAHLRIHSKNIYVLASSCEPLKYPESHAHRSEAWKGNPMRSPDFDHGPMSQNHGHPYQTYISHFIFLNSSMQSSLEENIRSVHHMW